MVDPRRPRVSIIVPHYNQKECLGRLLPGIARQTYHDCEVIVIDDCTPDKSILEYIRSCAQGCPNVRLLRNTQNMRFIKTVNLGVILARGEYVCLLNSDTEVARDFVQRNVEIMDADSSIGGLSCIIVDKDGNNWFTGGSLREGFPVNLRDDFRGIRAVDFVAGTAAFYRRGVFDRIGLFDENYIMYHEDVEFGLRMRAKTGYGACMFHEKLVVHYGVPSIPTGRIFYYGHRNNIMLLRKYSRRDLRRVLWLYSREAFSWLNGSLLRASPQSFSIAVNIVRGTLEGLVTRQSEL